MFRCRAGRRVILGLESVQVLRLDRPRPIRS